jgi:FKBP-type peptidyl-prolyl cis-trans isomerase FkpA
MRKTIQAIFGISIAALLLSSCGSSEFDGYKKAESGFHYRFFNEQNESGQKPKTDDELSVIYTIKLKSTDSMIANTWDQRPKDGIHKILLRPSSFKGSLEDALPMMSKGDSASFIVSADSFYLKTMGMPQLPPNLVPGDKIVMNVKLVEIKDAKTVAAEREKQKSENEKKFAELEMKSKTDLEKYLVDNKITVKPTESGLYYIEVKKGKGPKIMPGDTVQCWYKGMFLDGTVFNDNTKEPAPIEFPVGVERLIRGWDEGIPKMNVGGKAKLICPYMLAYGPRGDGQMIPPFSTLVFEIEIVGVKPGSKK